MMASLTLWHWLAIGIGGGIGAIARFSVVSWLNRVSESTFPWGTLTVNVVGSFIMGLAFVLFTIKYPQVSGSVRSFVLVGLLGAFTTFSSFALESLTLLQQDQPLAALLYMFGSVVLCLIVVSLGYSIGKFIF